MPVKTLKIANDHFTSKGCLFPKGLDYIEIVNEITKLGYTLSPYGLKKTCKCLIKTPWKTCGSGGQCQDFHSAFTEKRINDRIDTFKKCEALAPLLVRKNKTQHLVGSYGFKHVMERLLTENYVSNGEVILIMLKIGYGLQHRGGDNPNVDFLCTYSNSDTVELLEHNRYEGHKF
jgi:hypothetical protein